MVDFSDEELRTIREGLDRGEINEKDVPNQIKVKLRTHARKEIGQELTGLIKSGKVPFDEVKKSPELMGALQDAKKPGLADTLSRLAVGDPEVPDTFTSMMEAQDRGRAPKTAYDEQRDIWDRAVKKASKDPLYTIPQAFHDLKDYTIRTGENMASTPGIIGEQAIGALATTPPEESRAYEENAKRKLFLERTGQPVPPELEALVNEGVVPDPFMSSLPEQVLGFGLLGRGVTSFAGRMGLDASLGATQPFLERLGSIVSDEKSLEDLPPITPEEVAMSTLFSTLLGAGLEVGGRGIAKGAKFAGKGVAKAVGRAPEAVEPFDPHVRAREISVKRKGQEMAEKAQRETLLADFEPEGELQKGLVEDYDFLEGIKAKQTDPADIGATENQQARTLRNILREHTANLAKKAEQAKKKPETIPPDFEPPTKGSESPPLPPETTGKTGTPPPGALLGPEEGPDLTFTKTTTRPEPGEVLKDPEGLGPDLQRDTTPEADVIAKAPKGKNVRATTPEGTELEYRYVLANPDDVQGSVDADFRPREVAEGAQPRDRARQSTIDQLTEMASETKFDPRRLGESSVISEGAPNINPGAEVEAGHGRSALLAHIKKHKPELWKKYRTWLGNNAEKFGLTKEQVEQNPDLALYRQRVSQAETAKLAGESNVPTNLARSLPELARDDAKKLSREILAQYKPNADGDFVEGANRGFLTDFLSRFSASERASFMAKDGALSAEGKTRIKRALFAKAFDDLDTIQKISEDVDNPSKNITNAMLNTAHRFARLKEGIAEGERHTELDITKDITEALKKYEELRAGGADIDAYIKNEGRDLFEKLPELQKDLVDIFNQNRRSGKKITAILDEYARIADSDNLNPKQKGLLGQDLPPRPEEILELAIRRANEEPANLFSKKDKAPSAKSPGQKGTEADEPLIGGGDELEKGPYGPDGERKLGFRGRVEKIKSSQNNTFQQIPTTAKEEPAYNALSKSQVKKIRELEHTASDKPFWETEGPEVPPDVRGPKNPKGPEEPPVDPENTMVRVPEHEEAMAQAREALELADSQNVNVAIMEQPEAVAFVKEVLGGKPVFVKKLDANLHGYFQWDAKGNGAIVINNKLFNTPGLAERTILHEIGHMIDWMDERFLEHGPSGGNIFARMLSVKNEMKLTFEEFMKNEQLKADIKKISWAWRPFDESKADAKFLKYRNDGAELYADYVSALFNDPVWTKQQSPDLFALFFAGMKRKPETYLTYKKLMDTIISGQAPEFRHRNKVEGYKTGEQQQVANLERANETPSAKWERTMIDYFDFMYAVIKRRNEAKNIAKKLGVAFKEDPMYELEKLLYEGSEQELFGHDHWNKVLKPLEEAGISVDDFGVSLEHFLTLEGKARGLGQKLDPETGEPLFDIDAKGKKIPVMEYKWEDLAQPHGNTKKTAQEGLEYIYNMEGPEKYNLRKKVIEDSAKKFREIRKEFILDNPALKRMFPPKVLEILEQQEAYVAFDVVRYMSDNYGVGPSARIFERVGTVEAVGNPFVATALKDINIMHAVNLNEAKRSVVRFMRLYFPEQIQRAQYAFKGGVSVAKRPSDPNMALITYLDNGGKAKRFYVPKNLLEAFDTRNARSNYLFHIISKGTIPLRDLFVNKNPGFMLFNATRDYWSMANQLPGAKTNVFTIAKDWFRAIRPAYRSVFLNSIDKDLRVLFKEGGIISTTLKETMTDPDVAHT
ncbi:MAG: hypothetical protein ACREN0_00360, partial [Thermodesulfobacteriota bacterium]